MTTTTTFLAAVLMKAKVEADKAEANFRDLHGEPGYCGFAWVKVSGVRSNSKDGKMLINAGFRKSYDRGLDLWNPGGSNTQSMDIKEAGASAYAEVLRNAGLRAYMYSRAD